MSIEVRPVRDGDFFAWLDLYSRYAEFYNTPLTDQRALVLWSWLTDPEHEESGLVAVDGDRIVGFANIREFARPLEGDRGLYIDDLYVLQEERSKGVGHRLIETVRSIAAQHHLGVVQWITASDNVDAQRVYDSVASRTSWITYEIDLHRPVTRGRV